MKRAALAALAALMLWPCCVSAHEVPDDVRIKIFLKPEGDRMLILVHIPANALIDILFPTVPGSDWLDLKEIDGFAAEGAKVWVADLLSIREGDNPLATPRVLAARLSRASDSSFRTFQGALEHVNADRLPPDTLLLQDQAVVDTLLETPIGSVRSSFSFEPRFARVGVRVTTTLAFLPADGGIRQFEYEGDPETFKLDPSWGRAVAGLFRAGFAHYWQEKNYLLFFLCLALVFQRFRTLVKFVAVFCLAESLALIGAVLGLMPSTQWVIPLWGVLIAASIVYVGIEAIVAGATDDQRLGLAVATGLVFGSGFWFGLEPVTQFGGVHRLASVLAFNAGIVIGYIGAMALLVTAVSCLLRFSSAPRVAVIIVAAIAVRISWHQLLDRAHALSVVPMSLPVTNLAKFMLAGLAAAVAVSASVNRLRRMPSAAQ
jgi:hypothetical protein